MKSLHQIRMDNSPRVTMREALADLERLRDQGRSDTRSMRAALECESDIRRAEINGSSQVIATYLNPVN